MALSVNTAAQNDNIMSTPIIGARPQQGDKPVPKTAKKTRRKNPPKIRPTTDQIEMEVGRLMPSSKTV
jgi:hypothetical protein